jgi:hypothetical protein
MLNMKEGRKKYITLMKNCPQCGNKISKARKNQIFCSTKCRFKSWANKHPRLKTVQLFLFFLFILQGCAQASQGVNIAIIAQIESSNNPDAYNARTKATGLCQIKPIVLKEYDLAHKSRHLQQELFIEQFNLLVSDWYMNHRIPVLLKHYHLADTVNNRLAAYNEGALNLAKHRMPLETKRYIKKYNKIMED